MKNLFVLSLSSFILIWSTNLDAKQNKLKTWSLRKNNLSYRASFSCSNQPEGKSNKVNFILESNIDKEAAVKYINNYKNVNYTTIKANDNYYLKINNEIFDDNYFNCSNGSCKK